MSWAKEEKLYAGHGSRRASRRWRVCNDAFWAWHSMNRAGLRMNLPCGEKAHTLLPRSWSPDLLQQLNQAVSHMGLAISVQLTYRQASLLGPSHHVISLPCNNGGQHRAAGSSGCPPGMLSALRLHWRAGIGTRLSLIALA